MRAPTLALRPLAEADIPLVSVWLRQEEISRWFGDPDYWLEEIRERETRFFWIKHFIAEAEGEALGFARYYEAARFGPGYAWDCQPPGSFGIDYLVGDPARRGQGLGRTLAGLIGREAARAGAKRLFAHTSPANTASIRVLLANGYTPDAASGLYLCETAAEHA